MYSFTKSGTLVLVLFCVSLRLGSCFRRRTSIFGYNSDASQASPARRAGIGATARATEQQEMKVTLKEGDRIPEMTWPTRVQVDGKTDWGSLTTSGIFSGKRVIVFGVPGAFTPTCSSTHLPGFEQKYPAFRAKGIDEIYCYSVNDAFVMNAWFRDLGIKHVKFIPDGSGILAEKLSLLVPRDNLGFGVRSWRFAMLVDDGVIRHLSVEPRMAANSGEDPFEVSGADAMERLLQ
eukprot:GHVU01201290.1.p1 GENE.GHVU01201290.1~~GHVU01201290.1.p1  ORF type:complete len:234 (+),score=12.12 GHVU01201290.1:54-755(+)